MTREKQDALVALREAVQHCLECGWDYDDVRGTVEDVFEEYAREYGEER